MQSTCNWQSTFLWIVLLTWKRRLTIVMCLAQPVIYHVYIKKTVYINISYLPTPKSRTAKIKVIRGCVVESVTVLLGDKLTRWHPTWWKTARRHAEYPLGEWKFMPKLTQWQGCAGLGERFWSGLSRYHSRESDPTNSATTLHLFPASSSFAFITRLRVLESYYRDT